MVFDYLKKKDYWSEVGGVKGYLAALKQLGSDYKELTVIGNGYTKPESIWGRLELLTTIPKKSLNTRKWLHTTWHNDRREIRTIFLSTQINDLPAENSNQSLDNNEIENQSDVESVSFNSLVSFFLHD